jgi:hypothetical protein
MRAALALVAVLAVLASAAAPHHHGGVLGSHACAACVTRGAEPARDETPAVAPPATHSRLVVSPPRQAPVAGAPQGAVPGQSPPLA